MTKDEFLLTKLIEECAELIRVTTICLNYGLDAPQKEDRHSVNRQKLVSELDDVKATAVFLAAEGILPAVGDSRLSLSQAGKYDKLKRQLEEFLTKQETSSKPESK